MGGAPQNNKKTEFIIIGDLRLTEKLTHDRYILIIFIIFHSQHGTLFWLFHKWGGRVLAD